MQTLRSLIVGQQEEGLERLLSDVATDVGLALEFVRAPERAEVVFAVITRSDVVKVICGARQQTRAPIVALLALGDDHVARRAVDCGAQACWALDTPLDLLRFHLVTLFPTPKRLVTRPRPARVQLGSRARRLLDELRCVAISQPYPSCSIPVDAEARLEQAIRLDCQPATPAPFRFGVRARLELSLMRLDRSSIERLEQAVDLDLDEARERVA